MNPAIKRPFGNRQQRCTLHAFMLVLLTAVLTFTPQSSFASPQFLWWVNGFKNVLPKPVTSKGHLKQIVCQVFHKRIIEWNKKLPVPTPFPPPDTRSELLRVEPIACVVKSVSSLEKIVLYYDKVYKMLSGSEKRLRETFDTGPLIVTKATHQEVPNFCQTSSNNPVNIVTGNKHFAETDYTGKGQFPISFTRYFNSRLSLVARNIPNRRKRGYARWSHSYQNEVSLQNSSSYRPDGSIINFWTTNTKKELGTPYPAGILGIKTADGGFEVTTPANVVERYNKRGVLQSLKHIPSGETQTLKYDPSAKTIAVHHSLGYAITIHFHTVQESKVRGFPYTVVSYRHPYKLDTPEGIYRYSLRSSVDPLGQVYYRNVFTQVTFPDNTTKQYRYEDRHHPDKVTRIINALGQDEAVVTYGKISGRVLSSALANGVEQLNFSYSPAEEGAIGSIPGPGSTTVTNALGHSAVYHYKTILGLIPLFTSIEGQRVCSGCADASAYTYDREWGHMTSKTDHKGNMTRYTWDNERGLQTARTEAVGTPVERTIHTQWHPKFRLPIKITEPGKQTVMRYDSKGRLLSRTEKALP